MASQLSVQHLRKQFGNRPVVTDVSFQVGAGEVVGLLGPNGAGKTTCFYMIAGLVQPDFGEINLAGTNITGLPMYQRAALGLGYLPQEASIFRKLSVADNLLAIFESVTDLNPAERLERTDALLTEFNLTLNQIRLFSKYFFFIYSLLNNTSSKY